MGITSAHDGRHATGFSSTEGGVRLTFENRQVFQETFILAARPSADGRMVIFGDSNLELPMDPDAALLAGGVA